jgi:hypothetical protein
MRWARRVETTSVAHKPRDHREAEANFDRLSLRDQLALVREAAETRAAELTQAFPNVIAVSYGFRRRERRTRKIIERVPCVKLLVKRKWTRGTGDDVPGKVPKCLYAYWTVRGTRRLCALPTDVEDAREHARTRPHGLSNVRVRAEKPRDDEPRPSTLGVLACAVRRPDGVRYAVSCQHVLLPGCVVDDRFAPAAVSVLDGDGKKIATSVAVRGRLGDLTPLSLDAQLARIDDPAAVATALGDLTVQGFARDPDDALLSSRLFIHTPRGVIRAKVNAMRDRTLKIPYGGILGDVAHERLIELQTDEPTRGGDSGSPVFTRADGGQLMGMLIAGPPDTTPNRPGTLSHAIPAAHLLDPDRYIGARGETWKL